MRSRLHVPALVILASLLCAGVVRADRGGYVIERFHTDLTVQENGDLLVEEQIQVRFRERRHGIYRTIPVHYTDPKGFAYSYRFWLLGVTDEKGGRHRAKVSSSGRYRRIRIGDPDRTQTGRVQYVIRYRVRGALASHPEFDELYWNATGNEWQVPILEASATVRLPDAVDREGVDALAFIGRFGSIEDSVVVSPTAEKVTFQVTRQLGRLEGLTVAVAWPPGVVRHPGAARRIASLFVDNWILLAPFAAFAFLWRRYRLVGRDPDAGAPVAVRYEPPENLTPAEIGTLVDERMDPRDLTATIVDLAIRGHIVIRLQKEDQLFGLFEKEETWFESAASPPAEELKPHEREVVAGLFDGGDPVKLAKLRGKFYAWIPRIREALHDRLVREGYFVASPATVRRNWFLFGILAGLLTLAVGASWIQMRGGILPTGLPVPLVSAGLTFALFAGFAQAMPRRTKNGVRMRSWALGFEEFVDRVEKDRLERLDPRTVFETLLPYAMALGVSSRWAGKFEGIYDEGAPTWYVGHRGGTFTVRSFESSLSRTMEQAREGLSATPRSRGSSGFGGGGFSGGGGGGGGGGSW